jgi:hypothetical protein
MAAVSPAPKAVNDGQAGKRRAATSIRIQQSVADDLESAWLRARTTVDPRLSYTEFVSRLLRRALQEEARVSDQLWRCGSVAVSHGSPR